MQLLGIDHGYKKVGLAVGDTETKTARPLEIVPFKNQNQLFTKIDQLVKDYKVEKIVVGLPLQEADNDKHVTDVQNFICDLEEFTRINVESYDERFSTQAAQKLEQQHRKSKGREDDVAAMVILQSYLDSL